MTTITTTCTGCGRSLAVPERYQGRNLKCPGCGHSFRIDPPPAPIPEPPRAAAVASPPAPPVATERPAAVEPGGPFGELFAAPAEAGTAPPEGAEAAPLATGPVYWRLVRLGILSAGIVSAVIHAVLGLVVGLAVAVGSLFLPAPAIPIVSAKLVGGLAIVTLPVLYGVAGFLVGLGISALYNLTARLVGGVKVLLE